MYVHMKEMRGQTLTIINSFKGREVKGIVCVSFLQFFCKCEIIFLI